MAFEPTILPKEGRKLRVGHVTLSKTGKTALIYVMEKFIGQIYTHDLRELLNGRPQVGIYRFKKFDKDKRRR